MHERFPRTVGLVALAAVLGATAARTGEDPAEALPPGLEPLARLVDDNRHVIGTEQGRLTGPGLDFLVREGRASEFFLVGESHNMAGIPELTGRLALALVGAGYGALAIEIGPVSAPAIAARLREGGIEAHRRFVERYPFTVPFYEQRPEAELLATALEAGYEIWGLDQEFIGSGRWLLDRLAELAADEEARELVAVFRQRELAAAAHYRETGSTEKVILSTTSTEEFQRLRAAFDGAAAPAREQAYSIVDALATSARIYQLWRIDNYENNRIRVEYMKQNLVRHLAARERRTGTPAKVLLKFGSVHTVRGRTVTNQFDLGNLALELAVARGGRSFHLWTTALGLRRPDGSFDDWRSEEPGWRVFASRVDPARAWTVFDLRPLRSWFHDETNREGNEDLAETVFQHDALAVAPELHRSEPLVGGVESSP